MILLVLLVLGVPGWIVLVPSDEVTVRMDPLDQMLRKETRKRKRDHKGFGAAETEPERKKKKKNGLKRK